MSKGKRKSKKQRIEERAKREAAKASLMNTKEIASEGQTEQTANATDCRANGKQRWYKRFATWIKEKSSFTDWCLVVFTGVLALVSFYQFLVMREQITDSEDAQSAQLVVEDFKPTLTLGEPGQGMLLQGDIKITNGGPSVAHGLYINIASWGARTKPDVWVELAKLKAIPNPVGPSILPTKSISYPVGTQYGNWKEIESEQWFTGWKIAVSYLDIFNRRHIQTDCFMYYADQRQQQFFRCPGEMHATGDVQKGDK